MNTQDYIRLENQYGPQIYKPIDVVITRGDGVYVYDVEGRKYLDCLSGYSALNHGHVHPRLVKVMTEQAAQLTLTSRAFRNDKFAEFMQRLSEVTGYEKSLPMNSGAEAVETALKLARKWAYTVKGVPLNQAEIIAAEGNFHGRTITVISASSEPLYKDLFGPHTPGFVIAPYADADAIADAITPNTAAVLLEPLQGEGGVIVPPDGYLRRVHETCKANNVLFMADEIQTGLGRTGKLFACQHEEVRPEVTIIGKALSGGFYPVSAVLADAQYMDVLQYAEHGSTFGGNPLACAIATEALNIILDEGLIENAAALGEYYQERLAEIPSPHVKEVRGKGLLIGVELKPSAGGARRFGEALKERGILVKDAHETVLRFAPPLIIDRATLDATIGPITEVLNLP
ncbi:MAG: ornithine--oxo-acid transaminase [Anaerolineales bacterium]